MATLAEFIRQAVALADYRNLAVENPILCSFRWATART